ncbi:enoyl-CoA hydratase [Nakamurella sp. YIM 132087]|uniref:Enoyl-CoA hydratase n=1 Tax=Nakamurella alba TaxID=2665158 RepID=A0A7K1FIY1_9ACTN|nr:enoyl-CoA hydratase-related protein [Nakamurella alba]MTD14030.1 enoyl-CoA hydratase [Nakamurella alba]
METTEIRYQVADRIATITLDRPERRNAFTTTMAAELVAAFTAADADDEVRVVVVTGAGGAFCVGAELRPTGGTFDRPPDHAAARDTRGTIGGVRRDGGGTVSLAIAAMRKPVIAALNGSAVGVGLTMTLPMDIRIAADDGKYGFPFVRRGIAPEAASGWFLPRVVGIGQAMEWVATGRIFDAAEALRGGLFSRIVPPDQVLPVAYGIASDIAVNTSGVASGAARQLLWSMLGAASPWDSHRWESAALRELAAGPDVQEGVASFLERRPPRFAARLGPGGVAGVPRWPQPPADVDPPP